MAWNVTSAELLSGQGAKTTGQGLYSNDSDQYPMGHAFFFPETTPSAQDVWETITVRRVRLPSYLRSGDSVYLTVFCRGTFAGGATGGNAHQIRLDVNGTTGTAVTTTSATGDTLTTCTVDATGDAWADASLDVTIEGWDDSGATTNLVVSGFRLANNLRYVRQAE